MTTRPKILFLQTNLFPRGGATSVAAWMLETLRRHFAVTLLTADPVDWEEVNRMFGTSIGPGDVEVLLMNRALRMLFRLDPDPESIQPLAYMMRVCHRIRSQYDLVVCAAMEEADLGGHGLLYVHYPWLGAYWASHLDSARSITRRLAGLVRGTLRPWVLMSGYSIARMKQCRVLTNSDWTGARVSTYYGIATETVYPPITPVADQADWRARDCSFVSVGRLNSAKRFDWMIDVMRRVREAHPEVRFHIIGTRDRDKEAKAYYRRLVREVDANRDWLTLHEGPSRDELLRLLGRMKYAIHAKEDEHFGMAPAEALAAGCLPFVHDSGGQVEIVGREPRLCFTDRDDAVRKIRRVLSDAALRQDLKKFADARQRAFSVARFQEEFLHAVQASLDATR
jgi:glycosyltransferase involved in cell wall biosynthesis